ncbi:MAG: hypothetical protein II876_04790 [Synergistaceae bacterium]|nr:hypothetical protein [Synergistaceae bacterium]MBQ3758761.1 hypothetical protein [Synergistaceae bacterium]
MTKKLEELYAELDGKTERSEIEKILSGTTVVALRRYMKQEGMSYDGSSKLRKAELVQEIADGIMEALEVERIREETQKDEAATPKPGVSESSYAEEYGGEKAMKVRAMLMKYADIHATVRAIRGGIKFFQRMKEKQEASGQDGSALAKAIADVKMEYREMRLESFQLRRELLAVVSVKEILRACREFEAKCEETRRRHKK